jgi:alpha-tubulin suppressor-like RCC1 family protein
MFASRNFLFAKSAAAVAAGNELYAWGRNGFGELGLGDTANRSSPVQVGALTSWSILQASGRSSIFVIKTDGTLWAWGWNIFGVLGLGNTTSRSSPVQVGALTNWQNVSSSPYHTLAIKTDGTLWSWGFNSYGQLGLGNTTSYSSPKQIGSSSNWATIDAGGYFTSFAISTAGSLWAWGNGANGSLGLGNTTSYSSPKQIGALTNWSIVSASQSSQQSTAALKTDGTLWSWGINSYGQLGLGNTISYSSPKQIGALTDWSDISFGRRFCIAKKTNSTIWSWGQNNSGKLGQGDTTARSSPTQIGSLTNWSKISAGFYQTGAVKTDGTLWTWGSNTYGGLGVGNTTARSSPVQVGGLTTWVNVSSMYYTIVATKSV